MRIPTASSIRRSNSYLETGILSSRGSHSHLEALILEHITTQRSLHALPGKGGQILKLAVEGYSIKEIASQLRFDPRTVARRLDTLVVFERRHGAA